MVGPGDRAIRLARRRSSASCRATANLDDWWCQGFSEPGAGSDLASLRTSAVRDGDHYVVNGQKTWTTLAQYADWIFCLVRTNPAAKKQEGISFLLIDMKTPGITVRPIQTIDGGQEVNEVFFDDVRVPVENLVGEENKGWDYAKFLLGNERTGIARVGVSKARIRRIKQLAALERVGDRPLIEEPHFREKVAAVEVELKALEMTQLRVVADERKRERGKPNPASSILKLKGSELQQATTELLMDVVGPYVLPYDDHERRQQRAAGRARVRGGGGADLFQLAQDLDLWRLQRDPAEHRGQGDPGVLTRCRRRRIFDVGRNAGRIRRPACDAWQGRSPSSATRSASSRPQPDRQGRRQAGAGIPVRRGAGGSWRSAEDVARRLFKAEYLSLVRPFSAVPELLRRVRDAGLKVAVASSSKRKELETYLGIAGVTGLVERQKCRRTTSNSPSRLRTSSGPPGQARDRASQAVAIGDSHTTPSPRATGGMAGHRRAVRRVHRDGPARGGLRRGLSRTRRTLACYEESPLAR